MSEKNRHEPRFLIDRMLGTLGRYLRFMGYDTISANSIQPGNTREDSLLLEIASRDGRILLTRDRELAKRGAELALFISPVGVILQLQELIDIGLVEPRLMMNRCSWCNKKLRRARFSEILGSNYAPVQRIDLKFLWCTDCRKLYWTGSHAEDISNRLKKGIRRPGESAGRLR
jgi:uncharacterized protein with PIN domain